MAKAPPKKAGLGVTAFLLRPEAAEECRSALVDKGETFNLRDPLEGVLVQFPAAISVPPWIGAVRQLLETPESLKATAEAHSAVLLVKRSDRTFAIAFGHGWQRLKDHWLEHEFGRRVVLNMITRDQLTEIRSEQVFAKWHLASERAPRASSVDEFGVEFDRDLVAAVEGKPTDEVLGVTVRGGTSLRATLDLSELGAALDQVLLLFGSDAYKKTWPEIENLVLVKDESTVTKLEHLLDHLLRSDGAPHSLSMFTPATRRGETMTAESYVFGTLQGMPAHRPYLQLEFWLEWLKARGKGPSLQEAKATAVHLFDENGDGVGDGSVFDCLGCEVQLEGKPHVLSSGRWFSTSDDFVKRINTTIREIGPSSLKLPAWNGVEDEGEYNRRAAKSLGCLLFDEKFVWYGGGQSKFEFCDFMHEKSRILFFAKIASRSSGMSHLLEQARRTQELLFAIDPSYRRKLAKAFAKHHKNADVSWLEQGRPKNGDWSLCLVSLGRTAENLPLFAKCGLARVVADLRSRGHDVLFASV